MIRSAAIVASVATAMLSLAYLLGGGGLLAIAAGALLAQWAAFVPSFLARTERYYDLVGSLTYLGLVLTTWALVDTASPRAGVLSLCVAIWSARLGIFLARRVHRDGGDRRFDQLKTSAPRFLVAWTLQGLWVFLTPLAVWLVLLRPEPGLGLLDALGFALWAVGFAMEATADAQKSAFRAVPAHKGRYITTGLWAWSRHPNYLGEIVLWCGVFVSAASQLQGVEWVAVLSPVFVTVLLVAGSGIPLLEASADERWGEEPAYQAYKARTPVLFPWPRGGR